MRKSDRRAKKLQRLIEKFAGDPNADEKIARAMGWDKGSESEPRAAESPSEPGESETNDFEHHPLYQKGLKFASYLMRVVRLYTPRGAKRRPKWVEEATAWGTLIGAKLAAGLGRMDDDEIGFSIAHLKRSLRATHQTLRALKEIRALSLLPAKAIDRVTARLIELRDDVVGEVMSLRDEWKARFRR